jgi:hypothetical protein
MTFHAAASELLCTEIHVSAKMDFLALWENYLENSCSAMQEVGINSTA